MDDIPKSHFQQTVRLADWWLVKVESDSGRQLAVSGFSSRENQAKRVFLSAPILKRHDFFSLETTDGICIILNGVMNRARTIENGFPPDVHNHFLLGFPSYWKEYDEIFMGGTSSSNSDVNKLGADSVKDLREVKTKGKIRKKKIKAARSLGMPVAADNQKDNITSGENCSSDQNTRRKLAYETPTREITKVPDAAPDSLSFRRSRSGRLLMPTLQFWRNQRAIYSADRTICGIVEDPEQPTNGRKSMPTPGRRRNKQRRRVQ